MPYGDQSSWFAWDCPGLGTECLTSREPLQSPGNWMDRHPNCSATGGRAGRGRTLSPCLFNLKGKEEG